MGKRSQKLNNVRGFVYNVFRHHPSLFVSLLLAVLLIADVFTLGRFTGLTSISVYIILPALFVLFSLIKVIKFLKKSGRDRLDDLDTGLVVLFTTAIFVQMTGGIYSPAYPLFYLVLSLLVGFMGIRSTLTLIASVALVELIYTAIHGMFPGSLPIFALHGATMCLFSATVGALFHLERQKAKRAETVLERLSKAGPFQRPCKKEEEDNPLAQTTARQLEGDTPFHLDAILFDLLRILHSSISARAVLLCMLDQKGNHLIVNASVSEGVEILPSVPLRDMGAFVLSAIERKKWTLEEAEGKEGRAFPLYAKGEKTASLLASPVTSQDHTLGVIIAESPVPEGITRPHARLCAQTADLIGEFFVRATKYETNLSIMESTKRMEKALDDLTLPSRDLPQRVCRQAHELSGSDVVFLVQPDGDKLTITHRHPHDNEQDSISFPDNQGLAGQVFQTGKIFFEPDMKAWEKHATRADKKPIWGNGSNSPGHKGALILPLPMGENRMGVLVCLKQAEPVFDETKLPALRLLSHLGAQCLWVHNQMEKEDIRPGILWLDPERFEEKLTFKMEETSTKNRYLSILVIGFTKANETTSQEVATGLLADIDEEVSCCMLGEGTVAFALDGVDGIKAGELFAKFTEHQQKKSLAGGVCVFPMGGRTANELLDHARQAMKQAMADGGGRSYIWSSETS